MCLRTSLELEQVNSEVFRRNNQETKMRTIKTMPQIWKVILSLLLVGNLLHHASSAPPETRRFLLLCSPGSERRNICERCTKVTRDPRAYELCCDQRDGVLEWCKEFLNFTFRP